MKRPMIPEADGTWTTPEQLMLEIARMEMGRRRRHKPSALLLGALAGAAALLAVVVSGCALCYAVTAGGEPTANVQETHAPAVRAAEGRDTLLLYAPEEEIPEESGELPIPFVTTLEVERSTRTVPAPVQEVEDHSLIPGESRVLREGSDGLEEVTERVTYRNGVEESRETVSVVTVADPVPQITAVGTGTGQEAAPGRFQWPCRGRVTSPFGDRELFGEDDFHRGTDIAVPLGTEIHAAANGTVSFAGEKGTYGNLVQIDHGNGYVTCYAHCSEISVTPGQWVDQGQTIALAGSTGRSTGPHCHFEIRWQGEPFDPQSCLP